MDHVVKVLGHQEAAVRPFRGAAGLGQGLDQRLIALHAPHLADLHPVAQGLGEGGGVLAAPPDLIDDAALGLVRLLGLESLVALLHGLIVLSKAALLGQLGLGGVQLLVHLGHFAHQGLMAVKVLLGQKGLALLQLFGTLGLQLQILLIIHTAVPPYLIFSCSCLAIAS